MIALPLLAAAAGAAVSGKRRILDRLQRTASVGVLGIALWLGWNVAEYGCGQWAFFYLDELSVLLLLTVAILQATACWVSGPYLAEEGIEGAELVKYYALFQLFVFTMLLVLVVENLGIIWVAIEATTLASALLVAFYVSRNALEAAWKYVMVCTVGICLALLGLMILYHAQTTVGSAEVDALSWLALRRDVGALNPLFVKLALIFILIGYGTKIGLAPMHTWLPDAHSQAPAPISGLLSGALLSCAMYVLLRHLAIFQAVLPLEFLRPLLLGFGFCSIAIALPFILVQHDVKRLLAYSSVENMGIILVGIGLWTPLAMYGALLHLLNHALAKSALFYVAGVVAQRYHTKDILRLRALVRTMPLAGSLLLLLLLTITGAPPLGIFISKLTILWAAFLDGNWLLGSSVLLLLAGVCAGMLYHGWKICFMPEPRQAALLDLDRVTATAVGGSLLLLLIVGIAAPLRLVDLLQRAAAVVMGG